MSLGPLWRLHLKRVREVPGFLANQNATRFPQLVAETLSRYWGEDHYVYARSAFDRSRRVAGVWNGDARGWQGLQESVKHLLRAGLTLFPILGSDVGGYRHPILGWKHDLLPYYRSLLYQATRTGMPVARPLFLEFGEAASADGLADYFKEYLFGPELLVAPVTRKGERWREIELPPGGWLDYA